MTALTLSHPSIGDRVIGGTGITRKLFDWSSGALRPVVTPAPDQSGSIDTTTLHGEGSVTIGLRVDLRAGELEQVVRSFRRYTAAALRPTLTVDYEDGSDPLIVTLSQGTVTAPIQQATHRDVVLRFVAPYGIMESETVHSAVVRPGAGEGDGLEFADELEFGTTIEFPYVEPPGATVITQEGDRHAYPVVRAFGPFGGPAISTVIGNLTTGKTLTFSGVDIAEGDYLEINLRTKTITVNGVAEQSRYQFLSFPASSWWTLAPGDNEIAFRPDVWSGNAQMHVLWRHAYG